MSSFYCITGVLKSVAVLNSFLLEHFETGVTVHVIYETVCKEPLFTYYTGLQKNMGANTDYVLVYSGHNVGSIKKKKQV